MRSRPRAGVFPTITGDQITCTTVPILTYGYIADVPTVSWVRYRRQNLANALADATVEVHRLGVTITDAPQLAYVESLIASSDPDGKPYWMPEDCTGWPDVIRYRLTIHTRGYVRPQQGARP